MTTNFALRMERLLAITLAIGWLCGCSKEESDKPPSVEVAALNLEAVRAAVVEVRGQSKKQVDELRLLKARAMDLPDDMIGLAGFKERMAQVESILGTSAARANWLAGELETALKEGHPERIHFLEAQVKASLSDLGGIRERSVRLIHELKSFEDGVALQTSWIHKLPNGYEIKAAPGGFERKLLSFAEEPKVPFDPHAWYRFDRLYFVNIDAKLEQPRSDAQLTNVVEILKAYPALALDLSAFDRDVQRSAEVRERTTARLHVLKAELIHRGIGGARIRVLEYGPDCPPAAPERCRGSAAARPVRL